MTDIIDKPKVPSVSALAARLNSALDVKPAIEEDYPEAPPAPSYDDEYEYTQNKLKEIADLGAKAIDHLTDVATETSEPKAFQALAQLIKATSDAASNVMNTAKIKSDIANAGKQQAPQQGASFIQNNTENKIVFSGSTKDLLDEFKKEQEAIENGS